MVNEDLYIYAMKWWSVKCCTAMLWNDDQWRFVHLFYEVMVSKCCTFMLWSDGQWSVLDPCYKLMVGEVF